MTLAKNIPEIAIVAKSEIDWRSFLNSPGKSTKIEVIHDSGKIYHCLWTGFSMKINGIPTPEDYLVYGEQKQPNEWPLGWRPVKQ